MNWHQKKRAERVEISNLIISTIMDLDIPHSQKDALKMLVLKML